MQTPQYRFLGLALMVSVSLAACMDGSSVGSGDGASRSASAAARDVENPAAFSKRENGLWDGRPSLGGVWVAHPDVKSPERVIIRNTQTGQETIGALFRRERMNPGPAFQVSGEAATAIGMLAGAPTALEVVALRVEEGPAATATEIETAPQEAVAVAQTPRDVAGAAEAALAGQEPGEMMAEAPQAEPERRRGGLFGRMFGGRSDASARETQPEGPEGIETHSLGDSGFETAAAQPAPAQGQPLSAAAPAPAPAPPPMSPPTPAAATSQLAQPFIQLGIFSVEANAGNAKRMAEGAGLSARVVAGNTQGNAFWRVVVGPAQTAAEQRQMLEKVKSLGFADAYTVRR